MRLCSFIHFGASSYGVYDHGHIADIGATLAADYPTLASLLAREDFSAVALRAAAGGAPRYALGDVEFQAVIPNPAKIICVGLNYHDHMVETKHKPTEHPTLFARFADSQCGHDAPMLLPAISNEFDYEAELAVVIGKPGRNIRREDALGHVAGYSCYNDGSVRDWQVHTSQFLPGKNFPATGAFGPFLVTADEITDPQDLAIACRLNGVTVQAARTSDMIHTIADQIAYISRITPLGPGDVIATGTPGGVGFTRQPPLFIKEGDVVEIDIENIGVLRNRIVRDNSIPAT